MGVILIGILGIEKRPSRYPQLYSRVGFAHHYRPLQGDELAFVLASHRCRSGLCSTKPLSCLRLSFCCLLFLRRMPRRVHQRSREMGRAVAARP